jgi:hypothetical protein
MHSLARKFGIIAACTLACLVAADLVGVVASFFCDTFVSDRRSSTALFYAIWFVDGVFCGLLNYLTCDGLLSPEKKSEPTNRAGAGQSGLLIILTTTILLVTLSFLFYRLDWQYYGGDSVYVPDNEHLTITFFVTVLASIIFTHKNLGPEPKKPATTPRKHS